MTAAVPPPELRTRVTGIPDERSFLTVGARIANDIRGLFRLCGASLGAPGQRVLDFGCGSGRVLRHFRPEREAGTEFHGVDVDADAIGWCARELAGSFRVGAELPPLPFDDGWFDVVYAISVFTHLPEAAQEAWLDELRRVVRPGGVALLSVYGRLAARTLPPSARARLAGAGVLHGARTCFHTRGYVESRWSRVWVVERYAEAAILMSQDAVLLRR